MITPSESDAIALKRFSLISPVLNGQVASKKQYFEEVCANPIEMPHYGVRNYAPKTMYKWVSLYLQGGIDALKPSTRKDSGASRKIDPSLQDAIEEKIARYPRITKILLYNELVKDGHINPFTVSQATFYRYLGNHPYLLQKTEEDRQEKEMKRFSHPYINELWQTDIMYGPHLKVGNRKRKTYLVAYVDDASRLITHASFHFEQNFEVLRSTLKDAILTRGIPKMLYTDNGSIYRCGQLPMICASVGFQLLHAKPYTPTSKGKIERFFQTVRMRFLSCLNPDELKSIEELNQKFAKWLTEDYQCKEHSALGVSPLDFFMKQVNRIRFFHDPSVLEEHFLIRTTRKIHHDATINLESMLYETDPSFCNMKVEIRYDPLWIKDSTHTIWIFKDGKKIGEARQVNAHENARVKRKGTSIPLGPKGDTKTNPSKIPNEEPDKNQKAVFKNTISFAQLVGQENKAD